MLGTTVICSLLLLAGHEALLQRAAVSLPPRAPPSPPSPPSPRSSNATQLAAGPGQWLRGKEPVWLWMGPKLLSALLMKF